MKSVLALLVLAAALFVGACNNSTGATTAPASNPPVSSPVTSPEMSPEASPS
jgi:Spy/CpxP family protein refolding chaperone